MFVTKMVRPVFFTDFLQKSYKKMKPSQFCLVLGVHLDDISGNQINDQLEWNAVRFIPRKWAMTIKMLNYLDEKIRLAMLEA